MNVVDSSAWLEYFADGPNADFFAPTIENTSELVVPTRVFPLHVRRRPRGKGQRSTLTFPQTQSPGPANLVLCPRNSRNSDFCQKSIRLRKSR